MFLWYDILWRSSIIFDKKVQNIYNEINLWKKDSLYCEKHLQSAGETVMQMRELTKKQMILRGKRGIPLRCPYLYTIKRNKSVNNFSCLQTYYVRNKKDEVTKRNFLHIIHSIYNYFYYIYLYYWWIRYYKYPYFFYNHCQYIFFNSRLYLY